MRHQRRGQKARRKSQSLEVENSASVATLNHGDGNGLRNGGSLRRLERTVRAIAKARVGSSVIAVLAIHMQATAAFGADNATRHVLPNIAARGVFDPSVTEDPATGRLWMSYSSFDASTHSRWGIGLRLAYSDDGDTWHDAGRVQQFAEVKVGPLDATEAGESEVEADSPGIWQNEASTLVHDAQAPSEQRWKLFWHQSLWANDVPRYASYSWIALKMAESPASLAKAAPIKLFTGYMARSPGETAGAPVFSPLPTPPAIHLDRKDPQLGACVFGQPAALATRDGLYLALDCAWLGTRPQLHTTLLRCNAPTCNVTDAASWTVLGRLTDPRDGVQLNEHYKGFGGTALVEQGGQYFLVATPMTVEGDRYDGCIVFRFADFAKGQLERTRRGKLVASRTIQGIPDTHHGACAAHARLKGGVLLSQIVSTAAPRVMQIRRSGVELK